MKKGFILILLVTLIIPVYALEITKVSEIESRELKINRHIYGNGYVADITNNKISFIQQDRIQSSRFVTDSNGVMGQEFISLPFGQKLTDNERKYLFATGKELDSSGLYYFGARYYDPNLGRFTSVDPIKENHPYIYTSNNPIRSIDPTGADPKETKDMDQELKASIDMYYTDKWNSMVKKDISEIVEVAEQIGVPAEAILGAILVEDIRGWTPDVASTFSWTFVKASFRRMVPNKILIATGHKPNRKYGSSYGMVWDSTAMGSFKYLNSLDNLDQGTKNLVSKGSIQTWIGEDTGINYKGLSGLTDIEILALSLKSHMEYWARSGYDIFTHDFDTISTFGERAGVLETLNSIDSFAEKEDPSFGYFEGGVQPRNRYGEPRIPHKDPRLGGTDVWGWTDYGNIVRAFVDMGLASDMLK